jgi:predicted Zn-dependent protease
MSHHLQLSPEIDLAIRSWISRHKPALRLGCFSSILMAFLLLIGLVWAAVWGASYLKDYVAGKATLWIPVQWEQKLGDVALAQIKTQTRFINDPAVLESLNRIAAPLLSAVPNRSYRFALFVSDVREVNAFALPGGYLVFNRGLLERAKTPEEIQGVLAHEVAHVLKRHSLAQLAQNIGLGVAVQALWGNENPYLDYLIRNGSQLISLKFTRDHERAADDLGWELLQNAQINPQGMVNFFAELKAEMDVKGKGSYGPGAAFLSTHPTPQERIERLEHKKRAVGNYEFKSSVVEFKALQARLRTIP